MRGRCAAPASFGGFVEGYAQTPHIDAFHSLGKYAELTKRTLSQNLRTERLKGSIGFHAWLFKRRNVIISTFSRLNETTDTRVKHSNVPREGARTEGRRSAAHQHPRAKPTFPAADAVAGTAEGCQRGHRYRCHLTAAGHAAHRCHCRSPQRDAARAAATDRRRRHRGRGCRRSRRGRRDRVAGGGGPSRRRLQRMQNRTKTGKIGKDTHSHSIVRDLNSIR